MATSSEITIEGRLENLGEVRSFVTQSGERLGIASDILTELKLAVDEAVTNIIQHGHGGDTKDINISMIAIDNAVEIVIQDQAPPFDGNAYSEPMLSTPLDRRPYGGMGLYLIHQASDEVKFSYRPGRGNELRLVRNAVVKRS